MKNTKDLLWFVERGNIEPNGLLSISGIPINSFLHNSHKLNRAGRSLLYNSHNGDFFDFVGGIIRHRIPVKRREFVMALETYCSRNIRFSPDVVEMITNSNMGAFLGVEYVMLDKKHEKLYNRIYNSFADYNYEHTIHADYEFECHSHIYS